MEAKNTSVKGGNFHGVIQCNVNNSLINQF